MPHRWDDLILSLAAELDGAAIPYSFEASTANRHSPPGHPRRELIERFWSSKE